MANQLYQQLNNQNGLSGLINQFDQFRQSIQGDPKQMVQQLLNSGRMSQAQYNQLSQMANEFQKLLQR